MLWFNTSDVSDTVDQKSLLLMLASASIRNQANFPEERVYLRKALATKIKAVKRGEPVKLNYRTTYMRVI
jgi:hypothetical protein